ncbi:tetratricopeptide repeat protein [Chitinophaga sp. CF118]|uniref:tetratricopeptide repeat protein n=1 Tax=Chitinophaga sp. CF118 TaxID=1884367 RepID=UPI0015A662ED|nr:tetratricopeptide repeat protein [Chitinophaga sp. CF118]
MCLLFQAFFFTASAIAFPGSKAKALYKEGVFCIKSGQLMAAQQYFSAAISVDSGFTAAYLQLGNVYVLMHDLPSAQKQFRKVLQQEPANTEALETMANIFFEQNDYESALNYIEQAELSGADLLNRLKGLCYYKQGLYDKAIVVLLDAQKETPADADICYTLAGIYFNIKDFPKAVAAFEQARINGHPTDADFYLNIGTACLQTKQTDKGIDYLEACLSRRPGDPKALQALAHTHYTSGNYSKAIVQWNKLLFLQPGNAFARFMLGKAYIGNGEIAKGEALCDKATEITN